MFFCLAVYYHFVNIFFFLTFWLFVGGFLHYTLPQNDVVRIVNGPLPEARRWTQSRLLRAVKAYVRDGFLPTEVLARAGRRETDDRLPAIIAGIKGADPDITLQAICERLESMREPTPRGRTRWQPSSVKMLLERAERLGLMPYESSQDQM